MMILWDAKGCVDSLVRAIRSSDYSEWRSKISCFRYEN